MRKSALCAVLLLHSTVCLWSANASELALSNPAELSRISAGRAAQSKEKGDRDFPIKTLTVLLNPGLTEEAEKGNPRGYSAYDYRSLKNLKKILTNLPCSVDYVTSIEEFAKAL